ncbi:hypothetical protein, partial [Bacillus cereus]|uniref:hypothetical protein n=1 Tax=Bacillus cereus TaxID=1396 RepID=UPI003D1839D3
QMKTAVDIHTCLESEGYDISYGTVLRTIKALVHTQKGVEPASPSEMDIFECSENITTIKVVHL